MALLGVVSFDPESDLQASTIVDVWLDWVSHVSVVIYYDSGEALELVDQRSEWMVGPEFRVRVEKAAEDALRVWGESGARVEHEWSDLGV